jgi:SAM-dependent methyltransferase
MQPAYRAVAAEIGLSRGAFLDLAAGYGWICIHVASGKPDLDAIGLVTADRLPVAEKNRQRRLNVTFKDEPPTALTFPADTFGAVLAHACVQEWADPDAVVAEVHRVLQPGGRLFVYDPQPDGTIDAPWIARRGGWPPDGVVRSYLRRKAADGVRWDALKAAIKASPFGGGEEGAHGLYRRIVTEKPR